MPNVTTLPRQSLPTPTDLELRYGDQPIFHVYAEDVHPGGVDPLDTTPWTLTADNEAYDGESHESAVTNLVARNDGGNQADISITTIDATQGTYRVAFLQSLCPANPAEGEYIIVFCYFRINDGNSPAAGIGSRRMVISYAHNADFA